ncbi:hypothetical protein Lfu02_28780 [Longispora fulva]|uniref:Uncharacterized protein n=1 Tax=Longispora fulva TaxID=619741 RepID=A0A8J7GLL4_9ACTN|nr:hypothetical protein [Longispora fulva]MBG6139013.1 hypothetical protein [Longispora fulva]GIG58506.1 hypothetical protein Lfu02_28780 [Longispora fulva]
MLKTSPAQVKELGERIVSFLDSYGPADGDAVLFVDDEGRFGFDAGPDCPAGCRTVMNRAGVDRLMVLHGYLPQDLGRADTRAAFAELIGENAWLS